jgi:membrane protease subunit (stomatin/prohibitin family)
MSLIDRVTYEPEQTGNFRDENTLVWRWPSDHLTLGSQLIVNQSQEAIFFKGGQALDLFGPGTHTLAADNLPLVHKIVNLPFGGKTPFTAEVYYINKHVKLDMKWGTSDPFRITDPLYHIIIPVRAYGQLGIRRRAWGQIFILDS